ncbi:MAG: papain-like cysteine peptidase [Muribaculaceae bacterium]|nr:papain-like cysteine peptidase [Muribaculaceae bacterium]
MMNKRCEIISLGTNCLVRNILTRHGIKPSKAQGELSCPFDLVLHPISVIVNAIENDFADYLDGFYYDVAKRRNIFDFFRKDSCWRKTDGTEFAHDKDFKSGDLEKLKDRIGRRVANFREIIGSDSKLLFVINIRDAESRSYINKLYDILKVKCKSKKFVLAVLDFNGISNSNFYPQVKVLNLPMPCDDYHKIWFKRSFYLRTELGAYTEKCVAEFIQNIIDTEF